MKQILNKTIFRITSAVIIIGIVAGVAFNVHSTKAATVDELKAQSSALQQQINDNNQKAKALAAQADTLQNKLAELDLQITQLQTEIAYTKAKINELQASLDKAQADLDHQKELLKNSIATLYKKTGVSTVEMLVGSDSFGEFINNQTYLETLKSGIQESAKKVIRLKQQIKSQQEDQKRLLGQQQTQQGLLQVTQTDQQNLLNSTKGQEAAYQQQVKDLKAQQAAIMIQIAAKTKVYYGDGSNGGYPTVWNNAPQDSMLDDWGMYNRECVSYTAFKVAQSGRNMPRWGFTRWGNGKDWLRSADADGIPYDRNPRVGDVAISSIGFYGHAMYVEAVSGRTVYVSQYNFDYRGRYSEMSISADNSNLGTLYFVHFP